jgi:hypothetical protein
MCQGIDLKLYKTISGYTPHSAAAHGAGVYDFLNFTELVPANSNVLVSISSLTLIRLHEGERNNTGLVFKNLNKLFKSNYSPLIILNIIRNNFNNYGCIFSNNNTLYPTSHFHKNSTYSNIYNAFYHPPTYINARTKLYLHGIEKLIQKRCKINFILFPVQKTITGLVKKSNANCYLRLLFKQIETKNKIKLKIHEIFSNEKNFMYDYSHLNSNGAVFVTKKTVQIQALNDSYNLISFTLK